MWTKTAGWLALWLLIGSALTVAGCNGDAREFGTAVASADAVVLLEGLPHQLFEGELMEAERRSKPVRTSHGYPFYEPPLVPSAEDGPSADAGPLRCRVAPAVRW
jgi:hypothetical protein